VKTSSSTATGLIAIALAVVALIGLVFITLFYARGNPFGTLNDICVALGGILSGALASSLYSIHRTHDPRMSRFALGSGLLGACLAPIGSALVIFGVTGWFLAGLVTTVAYALIGLWLLALNSSARRWIAFPHRLARFGIVAGGVMAIGLLAVPGILTRSDAIESAPWFAVAALVIGGLGWNILYAIWCVWLGRLSLSNRLLLQASTSA